MKNVSVLGSGAWGSSIGNLIAKNDNKVKIWSIIPNVTKEINKKHTNKIYLPKINLSKNMSAHESLEEILENPEMIFIAIPSFAIYEVFKKIEKLKGKKYKMSFVICTKGIEQKSLKFVSEIIKEILPKSKIAVLSGPNFAIEVAKEIPSITTIATKKKKLYKEISAVLDNGYFKTFYSNDILGAQICGTVKNIIAISCGIVEGLGWGRNTFAAFITQGLKEAGDICKVFDGDREILTQPAGIGDLILTCTSRQSRNMSLGYQLGKGKKVREILGAQKHKTFEGLENANYAVKIAKKHKLDLPLCQAVQKILQNEFSVKKIKEILDQVI